VNVIGRIVDPMQIEYFFSNGFTHDLPRIYDLSFLLIISAMRLVQAEYKASCAPNRCMRAYFSKRQISRLVA
jgi:hypothetical protein